MPDTNVNITASGTLPGEQFACKLLDLIMKVLDGQPAEVRTELWRLYLEDVKAWRAFFGLKT